MTATLSISQALAAIALLACAVSGAAAQSCATPEYGQCGGNGPVTCCPTGFYCQPWNPQYYQCMPTPSQCPVQETDVDYYGNDLSKVTSIQPSDCCSKCSSTANCAAYTWVNVDGGTCYLKSQAGNKVAKAGAISGARGSTPPTSTPPTPTTAAPTPTTSGPTTTPITTAAPTTSSPGKCSPVWQQCGGENWTGPKCCESGSECVVTNEWYSQCLPSSAPTTAPTPTTAGPTTATPTTSSPGKCSPVWQQCGGENWTGAKCCESGSECVVTNEWYSQCLPSSAPTTAPTPTTAGPTTAGPTTATPTTSSPGKCSPVWQQCGGENWTGAKCCESGSHCVVTNEWYSQCLPNNKRLR